MAGEPGGQGEPAPRLTTPLAALVPMALLLCGSAVVEPENGTYAPGTATVTGDGYGSTPSGNNFTQFSFSGTVTLTKAP